MIRIALVLIVTLFVAGCHEHFRWHVHPIDNEADRPSIEEIAAEAQRRVLRACGYRAAIDPLIQVLDLAVPGLSQASQIAKAICDQVEKNTAGTRNKSAEDPEPPQLLGITIEGEFV